MSIVTLTTTKNALRDMAVRPSKLAGQVQIRCNKIHSLHIFEREIFKGARKPVEFTTEMFESSIPICIRFIKEGKIAFWIDGEEMKTLEKLESVLAWMKGSDEVMNERPVRPIGYRPDKDNLNPKPKQPLQDLVAELDDDRPSGSNYKTRASREMLLKDFIKDYGSDTPAVPVTKKLLKKK